MKELTKTQQMIQQVAAIVMLAGAALFLWQPLPATIMYTVGAVVFCCLQLLQRYEGANFIIRRLRRQQVLGLLAFLCGACCMVMQVGRFGFARRNEWVVCVAIGCVLLFYTAFRIPAELKKEAGGA